jgi:hypothetical protein
VDFVAVWLTGCCRGCPKCCTLSSFPPVHRPQACDCWRFVGVYGLTSGCAAEALFIEHSRHAHVVLLYCSAALLYRL